MKRDINFWLIQIPGWLLLFYLIYAQAIPAVNYETGVAMGTQESAENETPYWIVLPLIALWGAWGLWRLMR